MTVANKFSSACLFHTRDGRCELLPGGQDGVLETENLDPKSRRQNLRLTVATGGRGLQPVPVERAPKLRHRHRIWFELNEKRFAFWLGDVDKTGDPYQAASH